jgi:porphobilinogen deaminase
LALEAIICSVDGKQYLRDVERAQVKSGEEAKRLGQQLGQRLLDSGAKAILDNIQRH